MTSCRNNCIVATSLGLLSAAGCSGGNVSTPPPPAVLPSIYVVQNPASRTSGAGSILQFPINSSGAASPSATIMGPSGSFFNAVATDGQGNIYISSNNPTSTDVREYPAGSTGNAAPLRLIPSSMTTRVGAVDGLSTSSSGEIFIAEDYGGVQDFSSTANGDVAPTRDIRGAYESGAGLSTIGSANSVAADASGTLYVVNQGYLGLSSAPLLIFAPTATGNVAPAATISGDLTLLSAATSVATDSSGTIYITGVAKTGTYNPAIFVFAPGAKGNVAPLRLISGPSTKLGILGGVTVDSAGNIYVVSTSSPTAGAPPVVNPTVLEFSATANGDAPPISSFTSTAWTNPDNARSIAIH